MPEVPSAKLFCFPTQIRLLSVADGISAITEELRVPFGETEFPGNFGAAEFPLALVPTAIHGPIPRERRAEFAEKCRLHSLSRPMPEPVGQLLNRDEVRIEIDGMHRPEISRGVMVDDAAGIEPFYDGLGPKRHLGISRGPGIAWIMNPIDHVRVHVLLVAGGVVAHRIEHHRGMFLRDARVKGRM